MKAPTEVDSEGTFDYETEAELADPYRPPTYELDSSFFGGTTLDRAPEAAKRQRDGYGDASDLDQQTVKRQKEVQASSLAENESANHYPTPEK